MLGGMTCHCREGRDAIWAQGLTQVGHSLACSRSFVFQPECKSNPYQSPQSHERQPPPHLPPSQFLFLSWTQMSVFFTKLEKFSANISSNMFSVTFLSLSCFWDPIMQMLSHRFFKRSSFLLFLFSFSYSDWMIFTLILSSASSNLL